jgi:hypothetical protein
MSRRNSEKYTAEREAIVTATWGESISEKVILARVNALPGPALTRNQLGRFANRLSLRRKHPGRHWDKHTVEREAMLRVEWPGPKTIAEVHAIWSAMPGDRGTLQEMENFANYIGLRRGAKRKHTPKPAPVVVTAPVRTGKGIYNSTDEVVIARMIRRASDAFGAVGVLFTDIPDPDAPAPPRRGIMSGKPPNHAEMVAARVAMASQARMGVGDGFVRPLA